MTWDEAKARVERRAAACEQAAAAHMRDAQRLARGDTALGHVKWAAQVAATDALDAVALRLLLSHAIPREDRERALVALGAYEDDAEARRLLKLEAEP